MTGSSRREGDRGGGSHGQEGVHTREVPLGELDTWERAHRHADERKRPGKGLEEGEGRKEAWGCAPLCTDTRIGCLTNKSHSTECAILWRSRLKCRLWGIMSGRGKQTNLREGAP